MRRLLPLILLLSFAGCSGSASVSAGGGIDESKIEDQLTTSIEKTTGVAAKSVTCPDDIEAEKGASFKCTLTAPDGTKTTADGTVDTDKGRFSASAPVIQTTKLQDLIATNIAKQTGEQPEVDCPDYVTLQTGYVSQCDATIGGQTRKVTVTQKDDTGNVSYELGS